MKYFFSVLIGILVASCSQAQPPVPPTVPTGYLYKVSTANPGQQVYVCGQRPFNSNGELIGPGDLGRQARQVFENLKTALATVGMTLQNVTQVTYSIKDTSTQVNAVKSQLLAGIATAYFSKNPNIVEMKPTAQLTKDEVLIEVEVVAIK